MKAVLLSGLFLLSSCGMQGELYLPAPEDRVSQPAPTQTEDLQADISASH